MSEAKGDIFTNDYNSYAGPGDAPPPWAGTVEGETEYLQQVELEDGEVIHLRFMVIEGSELRTFSDFNKPSLLTVTSI